MNDIIFVSGTNGEAWVSSREVASKFQKSHKDVLKAHRNALNEVALEAFGERNFAPSTYLDEQGKRQPEILMTKDGFMFLAMGFTGPEASVWKVRFIDAFDKILGSIVELREELARKEEVILKLQGKQKRERRWLVPSYEDQLPGFPNEPRMVLKPQKEIKQPELNIAKYNHLKKTIEGIERQMEMLKREIGMI